MKMGIGCSGTMTHGALHYVMAELEALWQGLNISKQQGWIQVEIEMDAENVLKFDEERPLYPTFEEHD